MSQTYDVVIVGAGIAGAIIAKELGKAGKRVLILESGPANPPTSRQPYLENFYKATAKTPESPYPPLEGAKPSQEATPRNTIFAQFTDNIDAGFQQGKSPFIYDPDASYLLQEGPHPFASTYERIKGGTTWHWLGTSLRFLENDFRMQSEYGVERDWPLDVDDLLTYYNDAESEIGVSADKAVQEKDLGPIGLRYAPPDYEYPMQEIPLSLVDEGVVGGVQNTTDFVDFEGLDVLVTSTPQGRNSQPRGQRRSCAGNTNCIPICPIQAKYDATVTLADAEQTGNVTVIDQAVASRVTVDGNGNVSGIEYIPWTQDGGEPVAGRRQTAVGKIYVLAAHAIETPKLLLMSRSDQSGLANGVGNSSDLVGRSLMDHPLYLSWALMNDSVWGFRGPLSTSGIESLRDGSFRSERAAWRVEIGNEGWNFSIGDPWTSVLDFVNGSNVSQLNDRDQVLFGEALVARLNHAFTRQWRMGFLVEQTAEPSNRIVPADWNPSTANFVDGLGLPRPVINYDLSDYTKLGFVYAEIFARQVYQKLDVRCFTQNPETLTQSDGTQVRNPKWFPMEDAWRSLFTDLPDDLKDPKYTNLPSDAQGVPSGFQYFGSGHIVGTYTMGTAASNSVVDSDQRSWDHPNMFMVGSGVFPTITTANPTLTIAALAFKAADAIAKQLG